MIQKMIIDYLFNDEMKGKIIAELNKNVDIPIIGEKTEAKILYAVLDSIEEVLKKVNKMIKEERESNRLKRREWMI